MQVMTGSIRILVEWSVRQGVLAGVPASHYAQGRETRGTTESTGQGVTELDWHATTILSVRRGPTVAIGGDGQVTLGTTVMKADALKVRKLLDGQVLVGFAGSAADGFALLERFETKLKDYPNNVPRAATELAKLWRTDRILRRLEAVLIVVDARHSLLLSGSGDVIQPSDGILATGSGGGYALASARALVAHTDLSAGEIVRESLKIAGGIDIYTNGNITVEELQSVS